MTPAAAGVPLPLSASLLKRACAAALAGIALGAVVRYGIVEPPQLGWACQVAMAPWWCPLRSGLIAALQWGALGLAALAAAVPSVLGGHRGFCLAAAGLGGAGLFLYAAGPASVALLLALLRALRLPSAPAPSA